MRRILIFLLSLAAAFAGRGQTMTLGECVSLGIANNLSLVNARIDVAKARTGVSQNRSRLLPVINGAFQLTDYLKRPVNVTSGTLLGNDFPDNPTWQTIRSMQYNASAGVQLTVPLYNQGIYAAVDVAETVERLGSVSYDKAVEDLTVQIGKVYYLAQSSLEQSRLAEENIARMRQLCSIAEAMYEQGVALEVDFNRAKINLQNLTAQQDRFATLYAQQINMLRFLLDLSPETPLDVEPVSGEIEPFDAPGVSGALPELRLAATRRELADREIRAVKAGYIPTIALTGYAGGIGYQEKFGHFFHTRAASRNWFGNCFIGLSVNIPIFDGGAKRLRIRQHRYEAEQAANSAEVLRDRLNQEYANALSQLNHSVEVYRTQSESCRQASAVYGVTEEQYREGVASMTALLQDEMRLREAQAARVQARCQFDLARLDLLKLSGNLSIIQFPQAQIEVNEVKSENQALPE